MTASTLSGGCVAGPMIVKGNGGILHHSIGFCPAACGTRKKVWLLSCDPNTLHRSPCIGPLVHILLVCFATPEKIARNEGVLDEPISKELASMLKYGRTAKNIPEISTDLDRITSGQGHITACRSQKTPHAASILMISCPGRCKKITPRPR